MTATLPYVTRVPRLPRVPAATRLAAAQLRLLRALPSAPRPSDSHLASCFWCWEYHTGQIERIGWVLAGTTSDSVPSTPRCPICLSATASRVVYLRGPRSDQELHLTVCRRCGHVFRVFGDFDGYDIDDSRGPNSDTGSD